MIKGATGSMGDAQIPMSKGPKDIRGTDWQYEFFFK